MAGRNSVAWNAGGYVFSDSFNPQDICVVVCLYYELVVILPLLWYVPVRYVQ